jgi:hypothetical protein
VKSVNLRSSAQAPRQNLFTSLGVCAKVDDCALCAPVPLVITSKLSESTEYAFTGLCCFFCRLLACPFEPDLRPASFNAPCDFELVSYKVVPASFEEPVAEPPFERCEPCTSDADPARPACFCPSRWDPPDVHCRCVVSFPWYPPLFVPFVRPAVRDEDDFGTCCRER